MKKRAIICDLDGTLCNIDHRRPFLDKKPRDWDGFFAVMEGDKLNTNVGIVLGIYFNLGYVPLFVSGRMEKYRERTLAWLQKHLSPRIKPIILMRADNDFRKDAEVKLEIYRTKIEPEYDVRLILDDRSRVVSMWRELGLECWQVAPGDY